MIKRKKYTIEFKAEAIKLVTEQGYNVRQAAQSLGINPNNLHRWLDGQQGASKKDEASRPSKTQEQAEIERLRKEVARLKMEREILKKAAAFFANESD